MSFVALLLPLKPMSMARSPEDAEPWEDDGRESHARWTSLSEDVQVLWPLQERYECPALCRLALLSDEHERLSLRITALGETGLASVPSLLNTLTTTPFLRMGTRQYHVKEASLSHAVWTGLSTWADFLTPTSGQTIKLHLGTPLVLLPEITASPGKSYQFPAPYPLFAPLAQRWRELGGPPLPVECGDLLSSLEDGRIVLADYRLRGSQALLNGCVHVGFRGWITYQCRRSEALRLTLIALARFAFFAGVGAFTEHGMGVTWITIG